MQCRRSACGGRRLFDQRLLERLLGIRGETLIAGRVDKNTGSILGIAVQFCEHIEIATVGAKKYVTRQSQELGKCMLEVPHDAGIAHGVVGCCGEVVFLPKACSSDDDDVA